MVTTAAKKANHENGTRSTPTPLGARRRGQRRQAALAVIGGQNVLFSAAAQKLYQLDDAAAYLWRCVEDGMDRGEILAEMAGHGIDPKVAETSVRSTLRQLRQLGLLRTSATRVSPGETWRCQTLQLAGLDVVIRYATARAGSAASAFRHMERPRTEPDVVFDVHEEKNRFDLFRNDRFIGSCSAEGLAATLKAELLSEVLEHGRYELALHTATILPDDRALLICGRPGAGKTTLSLALEHAGWAVAGDDLALLHASGSIAGVPFPIAVKAGAWKLLARYRPDLAEVPVSRRPDRKRVRYLPPQARVPAGPRRVGWVVQLRRRPGDDVSLAPMAPIEALECLLKDASGRDQNLSPAAFEALASLVNGAACYRLAYSRLEDAVRILRGSL